MKYSQGSTESLADFLYYIDPRNLVARCGEAHFCLTDEGDLRFLTDGVMLFADKGK